MARPKKVLPTYGTTVIKGVTYYRTRITDADGKRVSLYARTPEELTEKVEDARRQIADAAFRAENPTVHEYCEKWLTMHAAHIRETTLADYTSKVKIYIVEPLGDRYMAEITPDDVNMAITKAAKQSVSIYRSVQMLYKTIFASAEESHVIDKSPCKNLNPKGGKPAKEKQALTASQVKTLLDAVRGLPPYPFVMIGLYAGLRREEILALQWDCVDLDGKTPTIRVRRSWHTVHNRPVITDELKTKAARRDVPIPPQLVECLKEVKAASASDFVIANRTDGGALSGTQWARLWKYITTRSTKERTYTRYVNGQKIKRTVTPVLGERAPHNNTVVYTIDFPVTPHQLRHTYITNLIMAGVDPKTVQYLAGHENSKITMDIYAHLNYNRPEDMAEKISKAFQTVDLGSGAESENSGIKG